MTISISGDTGISANGVQFLVGQVITYAGSSVPTGFVKCNGAAISRTTYAKLFSVIGTTYGIGNGTTTFNVPEVRGEFARFLDDGRGIDVGRVLGSAQSDDLKSHTHTVPKFSGGAGGGPNNSLDTGGTTQATSSTGGSETRPRNVAFNALIFTGV